MFLPFWRVGMDGGKDLIVIPFGNCYDKRSAFLLAPVVRGILICGLLPVPSVGAVLSC